MLHTIAYQVRHEPDTPSVSHPLALPFRVTALGVLAALVDASLRETDIFYNRGRPEIADEGWEVKKKRLRKVRHSKSYVRLGIVQPAPEITHHSITESGRQIEGSGGSIAEPVLLQAGVRQVQSKDGSVRDETSS